MSWKEALRSLLLCLKPQFSLLLLKRLRMLSQLNLRYKRTSAPTTHGSVIRGQIEFVNVLVRHKDLEDESSRVCYLRERGLA